METEKRTTVNEAEPRLMMGEEQGTRTPGNAATRKLLTPRKAIHANCIDCVGSVSAVKDCQGDELYDHPCIFFPYRMGNRRPSAKLIGKFCLYCMGGNKKLVHECPSKTCPFLPCRMGKNPNVQLSDKQRQEKKEIAAAARRHRLKSLKVASGIEIFPQESTNDMVSIP
jgi:hypothetical protein